MARVKDELMDEEDGEINDLYDHDRAPTPPPPQRYRSRSRSVEFELAPSYQPNGEIERAPVEFQEITQEYQDSTTGCEYVTTCYSREQKDVDLKPADNTAGFSGYVRNCVDAIDRGRNLIFVANDPLAKAKVEEFTIEKCAADVKRVFFVVRNELVARRRYYDLSAKFPNVALLSLTRGKFCSSDGFLYVVTIDVLRSLLFHGVHIGANNSVVFDDCEYLGNKDFGYMYEEAISLLDFAQLILFFPKISNCSQIARWICTINVRSVESVFVSTSNALLKQFICYYNNGNATSMKQVVDSQGKLNEAALDLPKKEQAHVVVKDYKDIKEKTSNMFQLQNSLIRIVRTTKCLNCSPIMIYCHDTNNVEGIANLMGEFNFNTVGSFSAHMVNDLTSDEFKVRQHFRMITEAMDEDDKRSPLIEAAKQFAIRGIGIYHSGMLPILKEMTEQLFSENLLKVIVADEALLWETNMIFKAIIIHEPKITINAGYTRWMNGEEFQRIVQRTYGEGKDDPSLVIVVPILQLPLDFAKQYFEPKTTPIKSEFKYTATTVLNIVHREKLRDRLERRLFTSLQRKDESHEIMDELRNQSNVLKYTTIPDEERLKKYDDNSKALKQQEDVLYAEFAKFDEIKPFLRNGRVVKVCFKNLDFGYGVVLQKEAYKKLGSRITVAVLTTVESHDAEDQDLLRPAIEGEPTTMAVLDLKIAKDITRVSSHRLQLPVNMSFEDKLFKDWVQWCLTKEEEIAGHFPDLDPIEHVKIKDKIFADKWKNYKKLKDETEKLKKRIDNFDEKWQKYQEKNQLRDKVHKWIDIYESPTLGDLNEQFRAYKQLLKSLDFIDDDGKLTNKGLFAADLKSPHPILITEFAFAGLFKETDLANDFILGLTPLIEMKGESLRKCSSMSDEWKNLVREYSKEWQEITHESGRTLEENLTKTILMIGIKELLDQYIPFEELYRSLQLSVLPGYLGKALASFDKMLSEIYYFRHFLPKSDYSEEFWKSFKQTREERIQRSMALTTIANDFIKMEKMLENTVDS